MSEDENMIFNYKSAILNRMQRQFIFLLTITFLSCATSVAQTKKEKINAISVYFKSIDFDSTIKRFRVSSHKMADSGEIGPTHIFYYQKNDTIYKTETFIGHMHPQNFEYYYKNAELVYCRYTDYGKLSNQLNGAQRLKADYTVEYFFSNRKLIIVVLSPKNYKDHLKNSGSTIAEDAQYYLNFVK